MSSPKRVARLCSELSADPGFAAGARYFPRRVTDDDAVGIAAALADEFERGTARRAALAEEQGLHIACKSGCTGCCEIMVMIYRPEAMAIARFLAQPENAEARAAFLAAYPAWREAACDTPEQLTELFVSGRQKEYDDLHLQFWRKRVLCAFNRDGRCGIYPVRPLSCRNALALDTSANCCAEPPDGKPAAALSFVPLDEFLKKATRLLHAAHNANAGSDARHRHESVCSAVYKALLEIEAGKT